MIQVGVNSFRFIVLHNVPHTVSYSVSAIQTRLKILYALCATNNFQITSNASKKRLSLSTYAFCYIGLYQDCIRIVSDADQSEPVRSAQDMP